MESELTLVGHLAELRKRLLICLVVFFISSSISFPLSKYILAFLKLPAVGIIEKLAFFAPQEAFSVYVKVSFICGFIISLPVILHQVWAFVSPALGSEAKRHTVDFILFVFVMFAAGCIFSYFFLVPAALKFLLGFAADDLEPIISVSKYVSFVVGFILAGGLAFQMPVLSFLLSKMGVINHRLLRSKFKYALLLIAIAAAIITPTGDIFNMMLLALPMVVLYEISIWVARATQARL